MPDTAQAVHSGLLASDDHEAILEQLHRAHESRHDDSCWTDIEEVIAKVERIVANAKKS